MKLAGELAGTQQALAASVAVRRLVGSDDAALDPALPLRPPLARRGEEPQSIVAGTALGAPSRASPLLLK